MGLNETCQTKLNIILHAIVSFSTNVEENILKLLISCKIVTGTIATVCPRSSYPIYVITYYIKWVITSWTDSSISKLFGCVNPRTLAGKSVKLEIVKNG